MMIESSPLPLLFGERGLRLGNLRKARALPFLVDGRSDGGVSSCREFGECGGISIEVDEGLLCSLYTGSLGGNGGGLACELNLNGLKRESTVDIVVGVQGWIDPTLDIIDGLILLQ